MKYANWASLEEVKKDLRKVDLKSKVDKSNTYYFRRRWYIYYG